MTVSLLGDGITLIAMAWQVYQLSDAPSALAFVGLAMFLPQLVLLLVGGVVSDRFARRKVMMAADVVRASALVVLGVLSLSGQLQLWNVWVIAACYGAGTAFFGPAFDAIVPSLVPEAQLGQANALDQFIRPAATRLLGPAVGGLLVASVGPGWAFLTDACTFVISIACLLALRERPREGSFTDDDEPSSAVAQAREGLRFVRSRVWLWGTFVAATLAYLVFLGPAEVLLPFVVKNELGGSALELGLVLAAGGVGGIAASILMARRDLPRRNMTMVFCAWTVSTAMVAGYGLATHTWQLAAACFAFNAMESTGLIIWVTTKQLLVPNRLLGRVSSLEWFVTLGLLPLSYALVGPAVALLGAQATLVVAGSLGAAINLAFLFIPGMRSIEGTVHGRLSGADDIEPVAPLLAGSVR
jgi:MFS family permease